MHCTMDRKPTLQNGWAIMNCREPRKESMLKSRFDFFLLLVSSGLQGLVVDSRHLLRRLAVRSLPVVQFLLPSIRCLCREQQQLSARLPASHTILLLGTATSTLAWLLFQARWRPIQASKNAACPWPSDANFYQQQSL